MSSDSDFTRLASRIREQGIQVYGIGEKKTPKPFRMACNQFIYAETLTGDEVEQDGKKLTPHHAYQLIHNVLRTLSPENEATNLGEVSQELRKRYSDFDFRNYGHKTLSELIKATGRFELEGSKGNWTVKTKSND